MTRRRPESPSHTVNDREHRVLSLNSVRARYCICVLVHLLVVVIRAMMVIVWVTRVERRLTFSIDQLSLATSFLNFSTTTFGTALLWLTSWALQPLAMHFAFTKLQPLTVLHDRTSAWSGPGAAILAAWRNLGRGLQLPFWVIPLYLGAALGVGSSFSPSFTFESFNESVLSIRTLNSMTTALTKTDSSHLLWDQEPAAASLLTSYVYFRYLNEFLIPGLGYGKIYDTLADSASPELRATVPALSFQVDCGQVPQKNWTITTTPLDTDFNITVSGTLDQYALSASIIYTTAQANGSISGLPPTSGKVRCKILRGDPSITPPSRNAYIVVVASSPDDMLLDSQGSPGEFVSLSLGSVTNYAKVFGCSLTTFNSTTTIDGFNHPVNETDLLPPSDPHLWSTAAPLPSRGIPFEDLFSSMASASPISQNLQQSNEGGVIDDFIAEAISVSHNLQIFETGIRNGTTVLFAALGGLYGYTNISNDVIAAGWNPKPTLGVTTLPILRVRLKLSGLFTNAGFVFSVVFFVAAIAVIGRFPTAIDERLVGDSSLLSVLFMIRRSTLPGTINEGFHGENTDSKMALRRLGEGISVRLDEGELLVVDG